MGGTDLRRLADGLWYWTARHPDWHPGEFGREVGSYAALAGGDLLLIDPLLPDEANGIFKLIDERSADRLAILITIPYHTRSAEAIAARYRRSLGAKVWGHPAVGKRLADKRLLQAIEPGAQLPGDATAYAIGRPRRYEMPLHLPSHNAVVFGDSVVEADGRLRVWAQERVTPARRRFYTERFAPTLAPLVDLEPSRVLVTHGAPVLKGAAAALRDAVRSPPWYRHG